MSCQSPLILTALVTMRKKTRLATAFLTANRLQYCLRSRIKSLLNCTREKEDECMQLLESSSFWGIVSIIISIFLSFREQNRKQLEYTTRSARLISQKVILPPGIDITVDGVPVTDLVYSKVVFKNTGNKSIRSNDFAPSDPLGLTFESGKTNICKYHINADNVNANISCEEIVDRSRLNIKFDFMKPQESITLQIFHNVGFRVCGEMIEGTMGEPSFLNQTKKYIPAVAYVISFLIIIYSIVVNLLK